MIIVKTEWEMREWWVSDDQMQQWCLMWNGQPEFFLSVLTGDRDAGKLNCCTDDEVIDTTLFTMHSATRMRAGTWLALGWKWTLPGWYSVLCTRSVIMASAAPFIQHAVTPSPACLPFRQSPSCCLTLSVHRPSFLDKWN